MYKKLLLGLFFCLAILGTASATDWDVYPGDSIQDTIDSASANDKIIVHDSGGVPYTYQGSINIYKKVNLTSSGNVTINATSTLNPAVKVLSSGGGSTLQGFRITGATNNYGIELDLYHAAGGTTYILNNFLFNNKGGINLIDADGTVIMDNTISYRSGDGYGIRMTNSSSNKIYANTIYGNDTDGGILLQSGQNNLLENNQLVGISSDRGSGISIQDQWNTMLQNNITNFYNGISFEAIASDGNPNLIDGSALNNYISNCNFGIRVTDAYDILIMGNRVTGCENNAIYIPWSTNTTIAYNILTYSGSSALNIQSDNITILGNTIANNQRGLAIDGHNCNVYNNNFLYNLDQALVVYNDSNFNQPQPTGGNYWSNYLGVDANNDGFGDTPYTFTGDYATDSDYLPLMKPFWLVYRVEPINQATNVVLNQIIQITYNQEISPGTNWIELVNTKTGKTETVNIKISGNTLNLTPTKLLSPSTLYLVLIHTGAVNGQAGTPCPSLVSKFTTVAPLSVSTLDPANNAVNVALNKKITLTFNREIKAGSMWIELINTKTGKTEGFTSSISGKVLTLTPTKLLATSTIYQVLLHTGAVTDLAGSPTASKVTKFTTVPPLAVSTIDPANNAVRVALNKKITLTFNRSIKAGSMWIELINTKTGKPVAFTTSIYRNTLTLTPTITLNTATTYQVLLHTGAVTDLAGSPNQAYVSKFTTMSLILL